MRAIPLPKEDPNPKPARKTKQLPWGRWMGALGVAALVGGGGYSGWKYWPQIAGLLRPPPELQRVAIGSAIPLDSSPLAAAADGWTWLFADSEWRVPKEERREFNGGLLRLSQRMEKPQPNADAAIRARIVVREDDGGASVVLRSTAESRYRLALDARHRSVQLFHEANGKQRELGKFEFNKLPLLGDRVSLELYAEGEKFTALVNGKLAFEAKDDASKDPGNMGIEGDNVWFELAEMRALKEVKPVIAEATPAAPVPMPVPAPEPEPPKPAAATPAPVLDTTKWLATTDTQWQATYQRDVAGPFEKATADLKKQYLATLDSRAAAFPPSRANDAKPFQEERQKEGVVPESDEDGLLPAVKKLREGFRAQFAYLDKERFDRAKALHAKYDALLAKNEAALTQRQRSEEAAEIKAKREQIAAAWLKPAVAPMAPAARVAVGATTGPAKPAKLAPRDLVEKLLAMGAGVWVRNERGTMSGEIKKVDQLPDRDRFTVAHVDLRRERADSSPVTTADLTILDHLPDVTDLGLHGPAVTPQVVEKLRALRNIQTLTLEQCKMSAENYAVLVTLPELHTLYLRNLGSSDANMKVIGQCHKLKHLELNNLPLTDEGLVPIGKLVALEELDLNGLDRLTSIGIGNLVSPRLRRLGLSNVSVSTSVLEAVARFGGLESLTLSGNSLKDDQVAPLVALARLKTLNLNNTGITGTVFTKWPVRPSMESLHLQGETAITEAALKALTSAFPRLDALSFTSAPLSASAAAYSGLGRMRNLRNLNISGAGVNDEVVAEIAKADNLMYLTIPEAKLTDPGIAALSKLQRLNQIRIDEPPVTDAALKSFGKFKMLKTIDLGQGTSEETEKKLRESLGGMTIRKPN